MGATKHEEHEEATRDSPGGVSGVFPRSVCPLTCGRDEDSGAALPQLSGALRAAASQPPAPAPRPLRALEDVPEVREHAGPGERPLHGVRVRSSWEHHPIRAGPRWAVFSYSCKLK